MPTSSPTTVLVFSCFTLACATDVEDDVDALEDIDDDDDDDPAAELGLAAPADPNELPPYDPSCPGHAGGGGGGGGGTQNCLTGTQCFFITPYGPDEIWNGTLRGYRGHHSGSQYLCFYRTYLDENGSYIEEYERCDHPEVICAPECV